MRSRKLKKRGLLVTCWLGLIVVLLCGVFFGCDDSDTESTTVRGWVSATEPISGADLVFFDIHENQIGEPKHAATGNHGSFAVKIKNLPTDFRVTASGGRYQGDVFTAMFSADCLAYEPSNVVHINAVTTMVSAYLDRHPEKSIEEARKVIKEYLEIPDWVDIGSGLAGSERFFSHSLFMSESAANGGLRKYLNQLIDEIDYDPEITNPFQSQPLPPPEGTGSSIALGLAEGAASYVGGEALGWGLKETGIWNPDKDVEEMQRTVANISFQLDQLRNECKYYHDQLSQQVLKAQYDNKRHELDTLISAIFDTKDRLASLVTDPPSDDPDYIEDERQRIITMIYDKLIGSSKEIPLKLENPDSLIVMYNKILKGRHRFLRADVTNDAIKTQFDYFIKLQEWLLLLEVEYYHAIGEGTRKDGTEYHPNITKAIEQFREDTDNQKDLLKTPIPENTMIDVKNRNMIATEVPKICLSIGTAEYCWGPSFLPPIRMGRDDFDNMIEIQDNNYMHGFNDWRKPSYQEIEDFFIGHGDCSGGKGSQYLESQGWPEGLPADLSIGSSDWENSQYIYGGEERWRHFSIYDANACNLSGVPLGMWMNDECMIWHEENQNKEADWIAIRSMSDEEFNRYFYPSE